MSERLVNAVRKRARNERAGPRFDHPIVLSYLPDELLRALHASVFPWQVRNFGSLAELRSAIEDAPAGPVVLDATHVPDSTFQSLLTSLDGHSAGFLIYAARLSPTVAARVVSAARSSACELLIGEHDDTGHLLRHRMRHLATASARAVVLQAIARRLELLPGSCRDDILSTYSNAPIPRTVAQLALQCGTARRTLERQMVAATFLGGAATLLKCARAVRAWELLEHAGVELTGVATGAGYQSTRLMRHQFRWLVGHAPISVRRRITLSQFASILETRMTTPSREGNG